MCKNNAREKKKTCEDRIEKLQSDAAVVKNGARDQCVTVRASQISTDPNKTIAVPVFCIMLSVRRPETV